jgi:hypothetical protein
VKSVMMFPRSAFGVVLAAAGCGEAMPPPAPAAAALAPPASTPLRTRDDAMRALRAEPTWLPRLDACPADVMPAKISNAPFPLPVCAGDALAGCVERCRGGDARACLSSAMEVQVPGPPERISEALYLRACMLGSAGGCTNRAAGRLNERKHDVDDCTVRSFGASCGGDDAWGCAMFAFALAKTGKREGVSAAAKKACELTPNDEPCLAAMRVMMKSAEEQRGAPR